MMKTSDLIRSLADSVQPVRRLRPPVFRAASWLLLAAGVLGLLIVSQGLRPNFAERMAEGAFATSMIASLLTGVLATVATFMLSLPDRSRLWFLLPAPPLVLWLSTIGYQCLVGWVRVPPGAITVDVATSCLATLVLTSLPLSLAMFVMLRYAKAFRPSSVILMGSLAVSGITAAALSMFHPMDASLMILGWNIGTALIFAGVAVLFGRRVSRSQRKGARE